MYEVQYGRGAVHITADAEFLGGGGEHGMSSVRWACPTVSRGELAIISRHEDLVEALGAARVRVRVWDTRFCTVCEKAAMRQIEDQGAQSVSAQADASAAQTSVEFPQHEKLHAAKAATQAAGEFIDFLEERGMRLTHPDGYTMWTESTALREMLAEWVGIDLAELEREKRIMLDRIRAANS